MPMHAASPAEFATARANMVDGQLRPNKISNGRIQARFADVPREAFVAPSARPVAYMDEPAPQGAVPGREMFSPLVAASLVQALDPQPAEDVLVVAGGTGYTTAILAGLAGHVTMVEADTALAELARGNLSGYTNANVLAGDVTKPKTGKTYAAVLVDAPAGELPQGVLAQLADGGRLAAVRSGADGVLEAVLMTRRGKTFFTETLFESRGSILPAFAAQERFVF